MRITLTINVDGVAKNTEVIVKDPVVDTLGEEIPRGSRNYASTQPYTAADVSTLIKNSGITVSRVAAELGIPDTKLRNILRIKHRGFSEQDYNTIAEAINRIRGI